MATGKTGLQIVRYFCEKTFISPILYLLISRKGLKSMMAVPHDGKKKRSGKKYVLNCLCMRVLSRFSRV